MCTITIVPHERGVRLLCNRDERRTRPAAIPARIHDLGERLAAFPVDPQRGGTWVGVNDARVVVTLLNVHPSGPDPEVLGFRSSTVPKFQRFDGEARNVEPRNLGTSEPWNCVPDHRLKRSRGLIVRELLTCESPAHAAAIVENVDPHAFEPFQVVIVNERRVAVATSDGTALIRCTQRSLDTPLMFTTSSLGDAVVQQPRQRLFDRMVIRGRDGWLDGQARFHDHQWRGRPDISVRMERLDALTVSRTRIDLTNSGAQIHYEAPLNEAARDRVHECCSLH